MSENHVKFYFAYNSPYAFLANTRIEKELEPLGATTEYKPVYQPRTGSGGPAISSPRMKYIFEDVARFAEAYGLELNMGPLSDTGKACRGFLFAKGAGEGQALPRPHLPSALARREGPRRRSNPHRNRR